MGSRARNLRRAARRQAPKSEGHAKARALGEKRSVAFNGKIARDSRQADAAGLESRRKPTGKSAGRGPGRTKADQVLICGRHGIDRHLSRRQGHKRADINRY